MLSNECFVRAIFVTIEHVDRRTLGAFLHVPVSMLRGTSVVVLSWWMSTWAYLDTPKVLILSTSVICILLPSLHPSMQVGCPPPKRSCRPRRWYLTSHRVEAKIADLNFLLSSSVKSSRWWMRLSHPIGLCPLVRSSSTANAEDGTMDGRARDSRPLSAMSSLFLFSSLPSNVITHSDPPLLCIAQQLSTVLPSTSPPSVVKDSTSCKMLNEPKKKKVCIAQFRFQLFAYANEGDRV